MKRPWLALALGCSTPAPGPATPEAPAPPVVLLISLDTTRADALGAYADVSHWGLDLAPAQRPRPHTPHLDRLAHSGLRFRWALAHAPTTLSSHASVMTGLDPHGHRVVRNGFALDGQLPVLAERFEQAGWDTIAVVGSSALEGRMGLGRGFRVYEDRVSDKVRKRYEDPAARVVQRVEAALDGRTAAGTADQPLFLFVHFFDAHSPWDGAPADLRQAVVAGHCPGGQTGSGEDLGRWIQATRAGTQGAQDRACARALYLSEVAAVDAGIGQVLGAVEERFGDRLVVAFGDHGETLEELPARPYQHGLDVHLGSIHVPLVLNGTGRFDVPAGETVDRIARLQDLGSTVLGLARVSPGSLGEGVDLQDSWIPPGSVAPMPPPHFAEATKGPGGIAETGWPNRRLARTVALDGRMLTRAPYRDEAEAVWSLAPGQPKAEASPGAQQTLQRLLDRWDGAAPAAEAHTEMHPETEAALRALGYLP